MKEEGLVLMTTMVVGAGTRMTFDAKGMSIDGDWREINRILLLVFNHAYFVPRNRAIYLLNKCNHSL